MHLKTFIAVWVALTATVAGASGFGLYQMSAKAQALGGAVVGRAVDASANFYNPATLSDLTNVTATVGFVTEHPRARMKVEGGPSTAMDPGLFWLPHANLAIPLPYDFVFGVGVAPEFGLGTAYDDNWELVNSSQETTVQSFTVAPNVSYAITERWSVAAGMRFIFFDFEQYSQPIPGQLYNRLWGDNRMGDFGWQAGTRYRLLDNLSVGLVYKSRINVNVEGKAETDGMMGKSPVDRTVHAETDIDMPDSVAAGFNWDITDTWHLGGAVMWTQWSLVDELNFNLGGVNTPCHLAWEDTYRFSLAPSWDFADDWTAILSYAYETDCCGSQDSTMLPPSERHMISSGLVWRATENLELALSYGLILLDGHTSDCTTADGVRHHYRAHGALCHSAGFTVTYRF